MAAFTPAGSSGLPITANIPGITSPTITNVDMILADTEYSYTLPGDTKKFYIQVRGGRSDLQLAFVSGDSDLTYITLYRGNWYSEEGIDTSANVTLYFRCPQSAQVLEILSWV